MVVQVCRVGSRHVCIRGGCLAGRGAVQQTHSRSEMAFRDVCDFVGVGATMSDILDQSEN